MLHIQAEKADELDLSNLYPDAHVVSDSVALYSELISLSIIREIFQRLERLRDANERDCMDAPRLFVKPYSNKKLKAYDRLLG